MSWITVTVRTVMVHSRVLAHSCPRRRCKDCLAYGVRRYGIHHSCACNGSQRPQSWSIGQSDEGGSP